jgi:hypothetical protein
MAVEEQPAIRASRHSECFSSGEAIPTVHQIRDYEARGRVAS